MITLVVDLERTAPNEQVVVGAPYEDLADLLRSDFQAAQSVDRHVAHLRAVIAGAEDPEERVGNAYAVIPGRDVCVVEEMHGMNPARLEVPTAELVHLLERWSAHLHG